MTTEDASLPGLSLAAFEKVQPFWWHLALSRDSSATIGAQQIGSTVRWAPSKPKPHKGCDWRPLTYAEMLCLQEILCSGRTSDDMRPGYSIDRSNNEARRYVRSKMRRGIRNRIRAWFRDRWNEVLQALAPTEN